MTAELALGLLQFLVMIAGGIAAVIVFRREVAQLGLAHERTDGWVEHLKEEVYGVKEQVTILLTRLETEEKMEAEFQRRRNYDQASRQRLSDVPSKRR